MTVSAVSPWRTALRRDVCLPASVLGPVLLIALRRLASNCLHDVIAAHPSNWVRFAILARMHRWPSAVDGFSAKERGLPRSDRYRCSSTIRIHPRSDAPRDGALDIMAQ